MSPPSRAARLYRALLRLFPGEFRADFGSEMEEVFASERGDARRGGRPALARLWLRTAWDALRVGPAQHLALLRRDGAYALRGLRRRPGFAAAIVATLALGFGVNAAMFGVLDATVLAPLAYRDAERLVVVWERDETGAASNTSWATYRDVAERSRSLASLAAIANGWASLAGGEAPELLFGLRVTHSFFDVFAVRPLVGRGFLAAEDRPAGERVVVLGHGLWRRRFGGDPAVVGRTVELSGRPVRVVGVLPAEFATTFTEALYDEEFDYLVPLRYDAVTESACRTCRHIVAVGRLRPGVTQGAAAAEVESVLAGLAREHPHDYPAAGGVLRPLREQVVAGARPGLLALWAAVGCLLLIATANVASLLLARTAERREELAIRAALGAGRARLFRQLLTESLVLAGAGAAAGVLLAAFVLRAALAAVPFPVPRLEEAALGARVLLFAAGASLLVGLAVTLVPAAHLLWRGLPAVVESGERASAGAARQRLRGVFVTAEV
ncbi:MAG TPA: ABC transporter permease, partial [Thermoanaerobaculia bacterium]|nr:ABC transporter permease [Thermoanaerobaculia bacterium]